MSNLSDEAALLIKDAQEYLSEVGPVYWDEHLKTHMMKVGSGECTLADAANVLRGDRELIIGRMVDHILREVSQEEISGRHGTRNTYNRGCRGLLCRRGNREDLRAIQGQNRSSRFEVPDELLDEAESRIKPEEIVGHIRFSDRIAV